jgi:hypothetical protein
MAPHHEVPIGWDRLEINAFERVPCYSRSPTAGIWSDSGAKEVAAAGPSHPDVNGSDTTKEAEEDWETQHIE